MTVISAIRLKAVLALLLFGVALLNAAPRASAAGDPVVTAPIDVTDVRYGTLAVRGVDIAYREAGDPTKATIVLLHGFPTSSHMFRELIPVLAQRYHVVAPDYPGFGASEMPALDEFDYSFATFADVMDEFLQQKQIDRYTLYVMDYGAPVGFRLFAKHPERVTGFVIQNGNAYEEGLGEFWDPLKAYWAEPTPANGDPLRAFFELDATVWQYTHGIPDAALELVSPDNWHHDQYLLDRPGNKDIQLRMFLSYGTNVPEYAKWQALFGAHQPPALLLWGKNDAILPEAGAHPYKRDLTDLEFYLLDTGHFALETHLGFISERILAFMDRTTVS